MKSAPAPDAPSYASTGADEVFDQISGGSAPQGTARSIVGRRQGYRGAIDARADPRFTRPAVIAAVGSRTEVPLVVVDEDPETQIAALSVLLSGANQTAKLGEYATLKDHVYFFVLGAATVVSPDDMVMARLEAASAVSKFIANAHGHMQQLVERMLDSGVDSANVDRFSKKAASKFASLVAPFLQFDHGLKFIIKAAEAPDGSLAADPRKIEVLKERAENNELFSAVTGRPVSPEDIDSLSVLPFAFDVKGDSISIRGQGAQGSQDVPMPSHTRRRIERSGLYAFLDVPIVETSIVRDAYMKGEEFAGLTELHVAVGNMSQSFGVGVSQ